MEQKNNQQQPVNGVIPRSDGSFLYKSKHDWSDVKILKQYDGEPTVLNLKYTPDYEELMDYFRGILHSGEISERAYEIAGFVVEKLASNYNAWYLRQLCIEKVESITFEQELEFVNDLIDGNEKVFQIWDHRKYLIEKLNNPQGEIDFLEDVFEEENKNYHAWSYRIWLCQKFNLYEEEWQLLPKYFTEDIKNNSAWNYRFFLFSNKFYKTEEKNIKDELKFAFEKITLDPENEAGWNYLTGFFKNYEFLSLKQEFNENQKSQQNIFAKPVTQHNFDEFPEVEQFCNEILKKQPKNRFLINLLIEILLNQKQPTQENIKQVLIYCDYLANDIDKIRTNYWNWVQENIKSDFKNILEEKQQK